MADNTFTIRGDFPPVEYDQWRTQVEKELAGAPFEKKLVTRTYEGIDLQPIYTKRDQLLAEDGSGFPGSPPFVRGSSVEGRVHAGLDLRQEYSHPDLATTNEVILADLDGGVHSVLLELDSTARLGLDPDQASTESVSDRTGLLAFTVDDLAAALADVSLDKITVALDAGAAFLPATAELLALYQEQGTPAEAVRIAANADPLAVLAVAGYLPYSAADAWSQLADLTRRISSDYPQSKALAIDTAPYHHAGATAVQDLAFGLATGLEYLRALTAAGLAVDDVAKQILLRISLGTHHFLATAKLRAARLVWGQVLAECGCSAASGVPEIHARTSDRVLTHRDPHVNILRNTTSAFAACVGGASVFTSVPFDSLVGYPSKLSRRVARNTQHILVEESHLLRVIDPAGGSWMLDTMTEQLAAEAWKIFQEIESRGGMLKAVSSGWIADQVEAAYSPRAKDISRRKEGITGVSEFPNLSEEPLGHEKFDEMALQASAAKRIANARIADLPELAALGDADDKTAAATMAAAAGATIGQLAAALGFGKSELSATPLPMRRFAEPFEDLRDAADRWEAEQGQRPRVFLANMGPISHHTARATYSKNFFEAGGFEVVTNDGFQDDAAAAASAFVQSKATIAVICSSDKLYPTVVPPLAKQLKAAGARTVILAGSPGENEAAWRDAGVDRFIFMKCDVFATLRELLEEEGVLKK